LNGGAGIHGATVPAGYGTSDAPLNTRASSRELISDTSFTPKIDFYPNFIAILIQPFLIIGYLLPFYYLPLSTP